MKQYSLCALLVPLVLAACSSGSKSTSEEPTSTYSLTDSDNTATISGRVEYESSQLMMRNAEQMAEMVRKKIKKAQDLQAEANTEEDAVEINVEPAAVELLKDSMRVVLSRPDPDGARSNLFQRVLRELLDLGSANKVLRELTDEALEGINDKKERPGVQATYIVLLDNLMAEIKPNVNTNPTYRAIVERIRDSNLRIDDKVKSRQLLKVMSRPVSPSVTAEKILPRGKK